MKNLVFIFLSIGVLCILISLTVFSSFSQYWSEGVVQKEFDQLTNKEQIEVIVQQFNASGNIFNSSALPIEHLVNVVSYNITLSNIPETFTKYVSDNIDYKSIEYNIDYQCSNPAVKVLNTGEASCLGMNILLVNLILNYNNSIPTFLYFGVSENIGHVITVCFLNNTWYGLDPAYYYHWRVGGIIQLSCYSDFLPKLDRYTTYYYSLNADCMNTIN